jgi:hypothetical protein
MHRAAVAVQVQPTWQSPPDFEINSLFIIPRITVISPVPIQSAAALSQWSRIYRTTFRDHNAPNHKPY